MRDYTLEVISHHPKFKHETLQPYYVDGIDTIGVWGEEPFELRFHNHTGQSVQVRLSLDGTDVLTTEQATVAPTGKMWMVKPYSVLKLEAWPETMDGGARFVFGKTGASVALHTHGDLSNKGIIVAAVFVENYVPPARTVTQYWAGNNFGGGRRSRSRLSGVDSRSYSKGLVDCCDSNTLGIGPAGGMDVDYERSVGPAVGAGETIKQSLASVQGFRDPRLERTLRMRYEWWDDLQAKISKHTRIATKHPSGFKDQPRLADLKGTPRVERTRTAL